MDSVHKLQGLLSIFLAAALVFFVCALPAGAAEEAAEQTEEQTLPEEATLPAETTLPLETVPAQTQPEPVTLMTVAFARTLEEGTPDVTVQGTVVYAVDDLTVLQDRTGGICLEFAEETQLRPGLVVQVTGSRSAAGILVETCRVKGSTDLPAEEATLDSAEECVRVHLKDLTFQRGVLVQQSTAMPMFPTKPEGIGTGVPVEVWGVVVRETFYADTIMEAERQTQKPAAVTAAPSDGILLPGETIRLSCATETARIYYALSDDGETYTDYARYSGSIPVEKESGQLYLRAYALGEEDRQGDVTEFCFRIQAEEAQEESWNLYFGQLHAHTGLSGGTGTVEEAFAHAAAVPGLDFFAVTDQSNSFENDDLGDIRRDGAAISEDWAAGKRAAEEATGEDFVAIFGYEMAWPPRKQMGHINTFNTPGWQSHNQEEFSTLEAYYEALTTVPGSVSQFNHPGTANGYFRNFAHYSPRYDACIQLLEVGGEDGYRAYDYYTRALDLGWHVAPTNNQTNHDGSWGDASDVRTVVLARSLTEESLYEAMGKRRVYATEDKDLEIRYRLNGQIMGSILKEPAHTVTLELRDPTDLAIGTVEVVAEGDETLLTRKIDTDQETVTLSVPEGHSYYYIHITQPDGDVAVTAPVWVDLDVDAGVAGFSADIPEPVQGQEVLLTLELYNNETEPFRLERVSYTMDDLLLREEEMPGTVDALGTLRFRFPLRYDGLGLVEITAVAEGTIGGIPHRCEAVLSLRYQTEETQLPLSAISHVRTGTAGEVYKIRGNVTVGTANPYNAFPGTICLQDNTGGIVVADFFDAGIGLGTSVEITGQLTCQDGNPTLLMLDYVLTEEDPYNPLPKALKNSVAMVYEVYGGQLLYVEGEVVSLTRTKDRKGIAALVLKDLYGDLAEVRIGETIGRGTDGVNNLYAKIKTGDHVSAIGILHREEDGTAVLRVRNCQEVEPKEVPADQSNPKTGDRILLPVLGMLLSALLLAGIHEGRKRR